MSRDQDLVDAHLRAALRHAPDALAQPSAALDRDILAHAHLATKRSTRKLTLTGWLTFLDPLTRPVPAAALASVVLGVATTLMWRGELPPEADNRAPQPVLPVQRTQPVQSAPTVSPAPAEAAKTSQRDSQQARKPALTAPAVAPAPTPTATATPALTPPPAAPAPLAQQATPQAESQAAPQPAMTPLRATAQRAAAPAALPTQGDATSVAKVIDPLANLLAQLAPAHPAFLSLRQLQAATQQRWQGIDRFVEQPGDIVLRDAAGQVIGRLQFDATGVLWRADIGASATSSWRAPLDPPMLARLRQTLQNPEQTPP